MSSSAMSVEEECDEPPRKRALADALAGAIAGCVSRLVVNPLDVLKIRFQVQLEPIRAAHGKAAGGLVSKYTGLGQALVTIVKEEGITGLWRGTVPGLLLTVPYTAVQFVALQQFRQCAKEHGFMTKENKQIVSFVSGAFAGAAATVASYPFDLLRTTLAAQGEPKVYHSTLDAARGILKEQGVRGLYRGLGVTLVEIMPYAALQFGMYDIFKAAYLKAKRKPGAEAEQAGRPRAAKEELISLDRMICGLAAGLVAKLGTHPLDVVKKRFQIAGLKRSAQYGAALPPEALRSLRAAMRHIYLQEGLHGFYKGVLPSIIKSAPAAAVTFTVYDFVIAHLLSLPDKVPNDKYI